MGKDPAFQFYPGDWVQDTGCLSLASKGAWIDLLCAMWRSQTRGELSLPIVGYARIIRSLVDQTRAVIQELIDMGICDAINGDQSVTKTLHVTDCNQNITLRNRRMFREEKERESTRYRVQNFRNRQKNIDSNGNVTPLSSSSSSSSSSKYKELVVSVKPKLAKFTTEEFISSLKENPAYKRIDIDDQINRMKAWLSTPKGRGRKLTQGFIVNWLNRVDAPIEISGLFKPKLPEDPFEKTLQEIEKIKARSKDEHSNTS